MAEIKSCWWRRLEFDPCWLIGKKPERFRRVGDKTRWKILDFYWVGYIMNAKPGSINEEDLLGVEHLCFSDRVRVDRAMSRSRHVAECRSERTKCRGPWPHRLPHISTSSSPSTFTSHNISVYQQIVPPVNMHMDYSLWDRVLLQTIVELGWKGRICGKAIGIVTLGMLTVEL